MLRLLLYIMSDSFEGRLHELDGRLEKLARLCREREHHLNESVKNHHAGVRWSGFAGDSFTKDLLELELQTLICKEFVLKDNLRVTIGDGHALMCRVASIVDSDPDEGI